MRRIAAQYDKAIAPAYCEACHASLGVIGTIGFGWLALCGPGALVGAAGSREARRRHRHASAGVAIALAVGTVGGLGSLFEVFVTPDIRAWNRISVVIAFLSLLAVALLLDPLLARLRRRRRGAALAGLGLAAVLGFGAFEQTTPEDVPAYAVTARQWRSDAEFVREIQAHPVGAAVFQLPYVPFPEGYPNTPVGGQLATYATKYEPLRGYLHSTTLRWSYGAMKGRPADWPAQLTGQPLAFVTASVAAAGFDGVWVDPAGFDPAMAPRVEAALSSILGAAPLISPDRDLWFYDLRPYLARLEQTPSQAQHAALRERTLDPLRTACAAGGLELSDPSPTPRVATLTVRLAGGGTVADHVTVEPGATFVAISGQVRYAALTDDATATFGDLRAGPAGSLVIGLTGPPCPH